MTVLILLAVVSLAFPSPAAAQGGLMGLINPRDIAELTQLAMRLGAQTMKSNQELMQKPGRPEVKPLSMNASPSELFGQGLTNLMNPANLKLAGFNDNPSPAAPPIEKTHTLAKPSASLPKEFGETTLFKSAPLLSNADPPPAPPPPPHSTLGGGNSANPLGDALAPTMERGGQSLLNLAQSFLRGAGGGRGANERAYGPTRGGDLGARGGGDNGNNVIPNIRQLLPGARDNFGVQRGEGCLPFVNEFMQIAYGNCVKHADQRTWDAWGREIENGLTGGRIDFFRASKETCRMVAEREQCGQLRRAVSDCDILNSIQIAMNMQRAIQRCDEVGGIIDQNPASVMEGMNGLINGEVATGFLNNFLGR